MGFWEDLGNAASAVASTVGDIVEGAVETVTETAENIVNGVAHTVQDGVNTVTGWVAANGGPILGGIFNVAGGIVVGFIEGVQDIVVDLIHIVRDVGAIVGSVLRLDIPRVLEELLNLVIDLADLVLDLLRFFTLGYIISSVIDNFQREDLRAFVENLLRTELADDPSLDAILRRLNIRNGNWGLNFNANSRVMMFDTGTRGVAETIRQMHNNGDLDLFALANLLSFSSFSFNRPRTFVRVLGFGGSPSLLPVNRFHISRFLSGENLRLQIFALSPEALDDSLKVARKKFKKMGVNLSWNDDFGIPTLGRITAHEITRADEFRLDVSGSNQAIYFQNSGIKDPKAGECPVEALAAFHYQPDARGKELFGRVCGRDISEGEDILDCATPGRTDSCCITVNRQGEEQGETQGSGVIYRDIFPPYFSRYVLAHEIGHYFGLCHFGHDGIQNIMFSTAGGSKILDSGLWQYYLHSEPEFSYEDAKNVWRFIVDQMPECL